MDKSKYEILLFYNYVKIADPTKEMHHQRELCEKLSLLGRIIIAEEGINGTVEGPKRNTDKYIKEMRKDIRFTDTHFNK